MSNGKILVDPEGIRTMQQGYEMRIGRQRDAIGRLQDRLAAKDERIRELEQEVAQLRVNLKHVTGVVQAIHDEAPQPDDPHAARAEWIRSVPAPVTSGPSDSNSDEVLPFEAWTHSGEVRPSSSI